MRFLKEQRLEKLAVTVSARFLLNSPAGLQQLQGVTHFTLNKSWTGQEQVCLQS